MVVTGPLANTTVASLTVGGRPGDKQLHLVSGATLTSVDEVMLQDDGLIQVDNGTLAADSMSLAASPSAQFRGELVIAGGLGSAAVNVTNDIVIDSGGLLEYYGTLATTSLTAARLVINGSGIFLTDRVGGGSIDADWEIHGFVDLSFPNVDTDTQDFVIMPGRTLNMTGGYVATNTFRVEAGATATITDTTDLAIVAAPGVDVTGTLHMDHGQISSINLDVASTGRLEIGLGGLVAYENFAGIDMAGAATLAGTLELSIIDDYTPVIGDSFDFLVYASLVGAFDTVEGLSLGGGKHLLLTYGANALTVTVHLAGDLNGDGFVGIADLNTVLGNWNQDVAAGVGTVGDPTGDGFVGIADLNFVLGNWNAGTPPGMVADINLGLASGLTKERVLGRYSGEGSAIPEPGTVGVFGRGLGVLLGGRRNRADRNQTRGSCAARGVRAGVIRNRSGYHTDGRSLTMRGWQTITAALLGAALLSGSSAEAAIALGFVPVDNSAVMTGYTTYDMQVTTDTDWTAGAMLFELSAGSFYQHMQGADGGPPNLFLVSLFPDLAFDTYVVGNAVGGAGDIGRREAQLSFDTDLLDVSWYNMDQADIGTTTIARLTLTDDAAGSMSIMLTAGGSEMAEFGVEFAAGLSPSIARVIQEQASAEVPTARREPTYPTLGYVDPSVWPDLWQVWPVPDQYGYISTRDYGTLFQTPTYGTLDTSFDTTLTSSRSRHYGDRALNLWKVPLVPVADGPTATGTTPEPGTLGLVGVCVVVALLRRR